MKALEIRLAQVGPAPTTCDHCGHSPLEDVGLVAPRCPACQQFSFSHLQAQPPVEIDDVTVERTADGGAIISFGEGGA